ncbi:MAG TPA: CbiX/SirB N-terminal domain-containing protein [Desulfotignum sp.]|jgi:sirohydrochlorin ferrochelatase|nr:CbiX/SirB N-terminal domain-containing protein [Desulfotignum sp.]
MKALILAAHGSRQPASAREVAALAEKLDEKVRKDRAKGIYTVAHAFLQFCTPSLETVIQGLAEQGVDEMIIFPFFISAGSHVQSDIPREVDKVRSRYPGVRFSITRHLGVLEPIEEIILNEAAAGNEAFSPGIQAGR